MDAPGHPVYEARVAAEGKAGGPTDRRDVVFALTVVAALASVVLLIALT